MGIGIFVSTLVSLFVLVDPFGASAVFATLTQNLSILEQRKIALKGVTMAITLLIVFCFVGKAILGYTHVSLPDFRVAGGLLFLLRLFA